MAATPVVLTNRPEYVPLRKRIARFAIGFEKESKMASIDTSRAAMTGHAGGRSSQFFGTMAGAFAAWNDARITRKALGRLTDRELDDIGLCRGDIDNIAAHHR
ncbi:MAG: DUF1127 domain-containing protein [Paracoccaceae bacterium]